MTRYNQRLLTPNARLNNTSSFDTRGNSYVYDYAPGQRIPETKPLWRLRNGVGIPVDFYATNGSNLHMYVSANTAQYATSPALDTVAESWTVRTAPMSFPVGILYQNSVWYMVGVSGSGTGLIYTSSDGISWTLRVSASGGAGNTYMGVQGRYNGGLGRWEVTVFPAGANSTMQHSVDNGVTWTTGTLFPVYALSNTGGYWIAGGQGGNMSYGSVGPYTPTSITTPFTASPVSAIGQAQVMSSLEVLAATQNRQYAVTNSNPPTSWTLVAGPPLNGTEYVREFSTRTANLGQVNYSALTTHNRVLVSGIYLNLNPKLWKDVSPESQPVDNRLRLLNTSIARVSTGSAYANGIYQTYIY